MNDERKTREELLAEITELRRHVESFRAAEIECKRVEHALQDQLHFLQNLIDTIPNPIFYKNTEGVFLGCNTAFQKRLGRSKEEIVGKTSFDIFPRDYAVIYHTMDQASFSSPGEQVFETTLLYADGKLYDVIIYKGTFSGADGTVAGLVGVIVDITDRKRSREALQKAHDELELRVDRRTAQLAEANDELRREVAERRKAEEALKESAEKFKIFAYSVAHDLKSPTIGIYGLTKLLRERYRHVLDDRGQTFCEQIMRASENVVSLVEQINTYASAQETPLRMERVSPKELFRVIRDEMSSRLSIRAVDWREPDAVPDIVGDRICLLRVFRNLVDNALKYGGEELTLISIGYEQTKAFHIFTVTDDGAGIKDSDSERIFKLYQRDNSSAGIEGTGLGLAIVKEIVERHGGRVWAEAGGKRGVTFYVSIPRDLDRSAAA